MRSPGAVIGGASGSESAKLHGEYISGRSRWQVSNNELHDFPLNPIAKEPTLASGPSGAAAKDTRTSLQIPKPSVAAQPSQDT